MRVRPYARFKPRVGCSVNILMVIMAIGAMTTALVRRLK